MLERTSLAWTLALALTRRVVLEKRLHLGFYNHQQEKYHLMGKMELLSLNGCTRLFQFLFLLFGGPTCFPSLPLLTGAARIQSASRRRNSQ